MLTQAEPSSTVSTFLEYALKILIFVFMEEQVVVTIFCLQGGKKNLKLSPW